MEAGIDKLHEYVESLARMLYDSRGNITVQTAVTMLAIVKCIESALTAFLIKMKL